MIYIYLAATFYIYILYVWLSYNRKAEILNAFMLIIIIYNVSFTFYFVYIST